MSASASAHVFPTSQHTSAFSSNFRSRTIFAARKRHFARSCAETFFHVSKYLCASSTACRAISEVAFWKTPIISKGCEGFVDVRFSVVITFCPLSHIGYSRPNSAFTFFSASSIRVRFSVFEKSIKGSLVNSETWTICSAVAMVGPSSVCKHLFYCPYKLPYKRRPGRVFAVQSFPCGRFQKRALA